MNAKRIVCVGHIGPDHDEIMCDPTFRDSWHEGVADSMDAAPVAKPTPQERFGMMCGAMMDGDEHLDDTLDLEDDMEQRDWLRHGGA